MEPALELEPEPEPQPGAPPRPTQKRKRGRTFNLRQVEPGSVPTNRSLLQTLIRNHRTRLSRSRISDQGGGSENRVDLKIEDDKNIENDVKKIENIENMKNIENFENIEKIEIEPNNDSQKEVEIETETVKENEKKTENYEKNNENQNQNLESSMNQNQNIELETGEISSEPLTQTHKPTHSLMNILRQAHTVKQLPSKWTKHKSRSKCSSSPSRERSSIPSRPKFAAKHRDIREFYKSSGKVRPVLSSYLTGKVEEGGGNNNCMTQLGPVKIIRIIHIFMFSQDDH